MPVLADLRPHTAPFFPQPEEGSRQGHALLLGTSRDGKSFFDVGDLITEKRAADGYTGITANRKPGQGARALPSRADHPDRRRTGNMKEFWKKWRRAILFTAGGAAVGLVYYALAGCPTGSCAITANPWNTMVYTGLIGLLLSGSLGGCCCGGSCSRKPPE